VALAEPVEWPIRKRFFTREGGRLGALSFSCGADGSVLMDGNPEELRTANRFWIADDERWQSVEKEVAQLAPDLLRFHWLQRSGQCLAAFAAVALAGWAVLHRGKLPSELPWLLGAAGLAVLGLWGSPSLAAWLARRRVQASSERLGGLLHGGASVSASWAGPADGAGLSIEVEQLRPLSIQELPVLRSGLARTRSSCSPRTPQWQPPVHRSQTV